MVKGSPTALTSGVRDRLKVELITNGCGLINQSCLCNEAPIKTPKDGFGEVWGCWTHGGARRTASLKRAWKLYTLPITLTHTFLHVDVHVHPLLYTLLIS